jgi:hypothetical protein
MLMCSVLNMLFPVENEDYCGRNDNWDTESWSTSEGSESKLNLLTGWICTWAICKVRGLTLLLWVRTLWRCGDGLFLEVSPLVSNSHLMMLHSLLKNMLQTIDHLGIFGLGAPFSWLKKTRNCMGRDLNWILCSAWKKWIGGTPLEHPPYSPDLTQCDFWGCGLFQPWKQNSKASDQWSAARFWEVGRAM